MQFKKRKKKKPRSTKFYGGGRCSGRSAGDVPRGSKYRCGRELLILMNGDSGGLQRYSGGSSGFIPRARARTHPHVLCIREKRAQRWRRRTLNPTLRLAGGINRPRDPRLNKICTPNRRGSACRLFTFGQQQQQWWCYILYPSLDGPSCRATSAAALPVAVRPYYIHSERVVLSARTPPLPSGSSTRLRLSYYCLIGFLFSVKSSSAPVMVYIYNTYARESCKWINNIYIYITRV